MKISTTVKALLLALSLTGLSAQAQSHNWGNNPNWPDKESQHIDQHVIAQTKHHTQPYLDAQTSHNQSSGQWQAQHSHQPNKHGYKQQGNQRYGYTKPKNPYNNGINSPNHKFYRGGQLPVQYRGDRGQRYVIVNWHDHHGLYAPPTGMRWTYIDGRYILATIATGIIYNIIYGS